MKHFFEKGVKSSNYTKNLLLVLYKFNMWQEHVLRHMWFSYISIFMCRSSKKSKYHLYNTSELEETAQIGPL